MSIFTKTYFLYSPGLKFGVRLRSLRYNHAHARITQGAPANSDYHNHDRQFVPALAPATERLSLDDFGIFSTGDFAYNKDISLSRFLEHFVRPIPTAEHTELGGSVELNEWISEDVEASALEEATDSSLPSKAPLPVTTAPIGMAALSLAGMATATAAARILPVLEVPFEKVPAVEVPKVKEPAVRPTTVGGIASAEQLLEAVDSQNMNLFREAIAGRQWPHASSFENRLNSMVSFIATHSSTSEEAITLLEGFTTANPKVYLRDEILLQVIAKSFQEGGIRAATAIVFRCRSAFSIRSPKGRRTAPVTISYKDLLTPVIEKDGVSGAISVIEVLSKNRFLEDSKATSRALFGALFATEKGLGEKLKEWKAVSTSFGSVDGIDLVFDAVFSSDKVEIVQIDSILKHSKTYAHPFSTLAELICSLVRLQKSEEAQLVFSKVFITGRYFRSPLRRFVSEGDLKSVETLANLVTKCMFGEKKRAAKKKAAEANEETKKFEQFGEVIDKFTGTARSRQKPVKKYEEKKRKRHRMNEEELHELANEIRDAWAKLAKRSGDEKSTAELRTWCDLNGIPQISA